jgi:NAD(P)-dependent dehydrogenase (short-subunit alcohol dehydrogenase family)
MSDQEFAGRLAIVTGAASGIGAATAEAFHVAGATVIAVDLDADGLARLRDRLGATGQVPPPVTVVADVADTAAIVSTIDHAKLEGRRIHLVNCAASFIAAGAGATAREWSRSLEVNVAASALLTASIAERMPSGSTVVNIASISAHVAQPGRWTYNATKAAILALTRGEAFDYAERGIRVNAVSPGWIWTAEVAKAAGGDRERWEPVWGRYHLLRRLGEPAEIADAVLYLSSDRASFITGTELLVDGGYSAMGPEGLGETAAFAGSDGR